MRRTRVALVLLLLVASPVVGGLLAAAGRDPILVVSGLVLIGASVAAIAIRRYRTERPDDGDGGSWGIVPDWQYDGRFAEAGGLTVGEQAEEIEQIRTDAEEIERDRK